MLHDPIFERMEADDGKSAPGLQKADPGLHGTFEFRQFIVHRNPNCLKTQRGRWWPAPWVRQYPFA
jgi:hypothetical protein